jgi:hypothetical protein
MSEEQAVALPENVDQLVDQYVRLRDKLKEADEAHKKKTEQARAYLIMLNGKLLERLSEVGGESVKTPHGTVYQTTKRSASIADGDAFREYVINNGEFDLVDWRANANAVDDFIKEHAAVPPGVNFSTTITVGVRRPTK